MQTMQNEEVSNDRKERSFDQFLKELQELKSIESKIEYAIGYMEKSIGKEQTADFKAFWDARAACLALFRENISPFLRNQYWEKFSDLSKQARRLKDMLDVESDFAAEQIDIAVTAIEKGLDHLIDLIEKEADLDLPSHAEVLKKNFALYNTGQKELKHLNIFASRITSLRKELIKTEMRVRNKNKFFERLSKAGDRIFPRRKELIQEISGVFSADVENFIRHSQEERHPSYDLREEIKALQAVAKVLTLNTQTFSHTRLILSECWDKLKEKDKERKLEFDKRKEGFKKNAEELKAAIEEASAQFESGEWSIHQSLTFLDEIFSTMRKKDLGKEEIKLLRQLIAHFREKVLAKQKACEEEKQKQEEIRKSQKRELFEQYRAKCQSFLNQAKELNLEELVHQKELLNEEIQNSSLSKIEKNELDKCLKSFKEILREKKEQALMALPADEKLALKQLKELLIQKKEERNEYKEKVEQYRKLLGSSNLGFEKSLEYNTRIIEEKEAYEKAQKAVHEIEVKIGKLEL